MARKLHEVLSIAGALAIGPLLLWYGYSAGLMFGLAAVLYFFACAVIVPLLTYAGGRLKFLAWQVAILGLVLSVIVDDFRVGALASDREAFSVGYGLWVLGILLSSPLPIYFILRSFPPRRRYIPGALIAATALALYLGGALAAR